jgi:3-isopropylmalate/(R)-2-methylmalate dehydratase small subunit
MEKLDKIVSTAVPMPIEDVDTDQIIPARFLKAVSKEGFGENLIQRLEIYIKMAIKSLTLYLNNDTYQW